MEPVFFMLSLVHIVDIGNTIYYVASMASVYM